MSSSKMILWSWSGSPIQRKMVKGQKAKHSQKIILATGDNEQSITYLVLHIFQVQLYSLRVATDLEKSGNLKETSEIPKVGEFCCLNFIFSQVEDLILKIFWGSMPPDPLTGLGHTLELNLGLEMSPQGISYCLESGNPVF